MRLRIQDFELATTRSRHTWRLIDLTDTFAQWMSQHDYREEYFKDPSSMDLALEDYAGTLSEMLRKELSVLDENSMAALTGIGSLFGLTQASTLLESIALDIRGRLLVFFPGSLIGSSNYRLLDGHDGWNYLAIPITADNGK
jgi:hypothetical protein